MTDKPTILIVDDDNSVRKIIVSILKEQNYNLIQAVSGEDALAIVEKRGGDIDVILLDIVMPGLNGFEVLETIRGDEALAATRIIVITAKSLTANERRRLSEQSELLLQKGSFLDDDLLEDILSTLG